ncbi:MAG: DNA polymerase III subunit gamma/tau [Paracoccaceae bacterium]|nr:DNA polymerase III subunit gamma/tau [Paracoccaceae bacterium]
MSEKSSPYKVLARKYRPESFAELRGQDTMVRILKNAFAADRIAHSFILTGIRGTGKTTTARIIAKGLNCIGVDGTGQPTTDPCGKCENCIAIIEGRHVDVIEMDAASQTGVGDIREIIDSVHYSTTSARYKIYIIDEVHMLSTSAFNALLKTLEEPPLHVKFIFATTEIRKVPVTVLSRCQRFDLKRVEPEILITHLKSIADREQVKISEAAISIIVRASEGSVRDAMSMMDQAIAHGAEETSVEQVREMIGLADRSRILDLFSLIMEGNALSALNELSAQYAAGADPIVILKDLAEVTHWISVVKISPNTSEDPTVTTDERDRGLKFSNQLSMRSLTRMWQMLLKVLEEISFAPNSMMAAEMAIIRLTHVSELPSPDELIRKLEKNSYPEVQIGDVKKKSDNKSTVTSSIVSSGSGVAIAKVKEIIEDPLEQFKTFEDVVSLIRFNRDMKLLVETENYLRLVKYQPGRIEFQLTQEASIDIPSRLAKKLKSWTGENWGITIVNEGGGPTIAEKRDASKQNLHLKVMEHPMVKSVLENFPGSNIHEVHVQKLPLENSDNDNILISQEEEWDPFEENE